MLAGSEFSDFFWRSPALVAPELLGWVVHHGGVSLQVVETEAYLAADDRASHARSGPTARCRAMFGPVGRAYLYRSYGIHLCFNVVCHEPETGGAVLIRAGTVVEGVDLARRRRGLTAKEESSSFGLADGPGKFAQCLGLTKELDGSSLQCGPITLRKSQTLPPLHLTRRTERIGISQNRDAVLRFFLADCDDVSVQPRKSVRR